MKKAITNRIGSTRRAVLALAVAVPMLATSAAHAVDRKTERTWRANCASCHGKDGKADTEKGQKLKLPDMTAAAFQKGTTDDKIRNQILNGVDETKDGIKKQMDPFKDKLSSEQVDALVKFVRAFGK